MPTLSATSPLFAGFWRPTNDSPSVAKGPALRLFKETDSPEPLAQGAQPEQSGRYDGLVDSSLTFLAEIADAACVRRPVVNALAEIVQARQPERAAARLQQQLIRADLLVRGDELYKGLDEMNGTKLLRIAGQILKRVAQTADEEDIRATAQFASEIQESLPQAGTVNCYA
jgi:hypothetical protein